MGRWLTPIPLKFGPWLLSRATEFCALSQSSGSQTVIHGPQRDNERFIGGLQEENSLKNTVQFVVLLVCAAIDSFFLQILN